MLSSIEAIEIVFWLHHWMNHWRLCGSAIRFPVMAFPKALGDATSTQSIRGDVKGIYPVNPMQIHATLSEQVFTPWLVLVELLTTQIIQRLFAVINVC